MVGHNFINTEGSLALVLHTRGHQEAAVRGLFHQLGTQWYLVGETVPLELFNLSNLFSF